MMPYFVRLPSGKYGQFDSATPKFIHTDLSLEDVRERAGDMVAALAITVDCEGYANNVARFTMSDEREEGNPYDDRAGFGFSRYVGCIGAIMHEYGRKVAWDAYWQTMGNAMPDDIFPEGFWLDNRSAMDVAAEAKTAQPRMVCVGYVVKCFSKNDGWRYLSTGGIGWSVYKSQSCAPRWTRAGARRSARWARSSGMTVKVVRLVRRVP